MPLPNTSALFTWQNNSANRINTAGGVMNFQNIFWNSKF